MTRGLSDNQKAILAYLHTRVSTPQDDIVRSTPLDIIRRGQSANAALHGPSDDSEEAFPEPEAKSSRDGIASQWELRKHLKEAMGKDIADGNMSRLCKALHQRGLVESSGGAVQLIAFVDSKKVPVSQVEPVRYSLSDLEVHDVMTKATREALDAGKFGTNRMVARGDYWRLIKSALAAAHEAGQFKNAYFPHSSTAACSAIMTEWKKAGKVTLHHVLNPRRWSTGRVHAQAYMFGTGTV